ncbi:MAG: hypothetical protein J6M41_08760 [Prevotella sp.]|nr:hypothetical protein [Prevotella sp.]
MEIKWNIERMPKPQMSVFVSDSRWNRQRMVENIRRDCTVDVTVSERTKTSLNVSVSHENDNAPGEPGYDTFYVAHVPPACSDMAFVEKYFDNPFGPGHYCYYFRISKKQNMAALKYYLKQVLDELHLNIDTITVNLKIIGVDALKDAA